MWRGAPRTWSGKWSAKKCPSVGAAHGVEGRVVVCNAPLVEGAVMAATEAASGAPLDAVRRTAEELTPG